MRSLLFCAAMLVGSSIAGAGCSMYDGVDLELRLKPAAAATISPGLRAKVIEVTARRLRAGGFPDPSVDSDGSDRIVIRGAKPGDVDEIGRLAVDPGTLVFAVLSQQDAEHAVADPSFGNDPGPHGALARGKKLALTADDIASAKSSTDASGVPAVRFTTSRPEVFARLTSAHLGQPLAIFVDGRFLSAPVIEAPIGATGEITGRFTEAEASRLASVIGGGALPVPLALEPAPGER